MWDDCLQSWNKYKNVKGICVEMRRQITVYMDDDVYELLVKEAARRQLKNGEVVSLSKCANYIIKENLNGKPDSKPDSKPEPAKIPSENPSSDSEQDSKPNPFADITFD
jgi:hypothetical protein